MRSKASSACKTERVKECRIELLKKEKSQKDRRCLANSGTEHDFWMCQNEKEEAKRLQGVRNLRKDEEIAWPDWEEARKMENDEWTVEPEEEADVLEITTVSDAVEGTPVDLDGECRHEHVEAKLSRRGR